MSTRSIRSGRSVFVDLMGGISLIARQMRLYAERQIGSELDLGFPEMQVLMALSANREVNQDFIAQFIGVDKGAVAKTLAKLEKRALVSRKQNPENKRENLVRLTENADPVLARMGEIYRTWADRAFENISEDELKTFERVIETLCRNTSALLERTSGKESR